MGHLNDGDAGTALRGGRERERKREKERERIFATVFQKNNRYFPDGGKKIYEKRKEAKMKGKKKDGKEKNDKKGKKRKIKTRKRIKRKKKRRIEGPRKQDGIKG